MVSTRSQVQFVLTLILVAGSIVSARGEEGRLNVLFLGDRGHHRPAERAKQLIPVLAKRGIDVAYTEDVASLSADTLGKYDGLLIYANINEITPEQEKALLDYVAGGGGFVPIHCASYCFLNSESYVELVGAQFRRHGTGTFAVTPDKPDHALMKGFRGFESWDETYVHHRHNEKDRIVLSYRAGAEGREPWTWVRTHGEGRVFYTAWGHDHRTWGHPGFQNLIERGIRWACKDDPSVVPSYADPDSFTVPEMTAKRTDVMPFEYVEVGPKIPNYVADTKWGTQGEPLTKMQEPLEPNESIKHFVTPVGFEVRFFAGDPGHGKPIAMTWDGRGRLWVCETVDYPNELRPPGKGRDRVRIYEDTDGDGQADKFTVFAEQLSIPTAIVIAHGGAVVQDGTRTLFLKDTDGDDRADVRKELITGWQLGDTHGGVSNFRYGLDNWIWAMQGYNNSQPVINGEKQQRFRMGFFRFKLEEADDGTPEIAALEFIRSTNNNTWGLGISEEGFIFGSTANHNPSVYMPVPNRYYERVRGWAPRQLGTIADTHLFEPITDRVRQVDHHGGYTAGAGHALYTARSFPREYWNRTAFVCGPTGHLIGTFVLGPDGSGFSSTSPFSILASDDEWSAPIMAEVGPDGALWVIDWYNYIVQHNPTPRGFETGKGNAYESDLRDKSHGRIYRVVYSGQSDPLFNGEPKAIAATESTNTAAFGLPLNDASPQQLVKTLKHPSMRWRLHAQRLLVQRGKPDVVPQLIELVGDDSLDEIGLNVGAIHALWTLHGLGVLEDPDAEATKAAVAALDHPSPGVRRNALQVLPRSPASTAAILKSGVLSDPDAHVRHAALLALADMPATDNAGRRLAEVGRIGNPSHDRWINDALTSAAAVHALPFIESLADSKSELNSNTLQVAEIVAEHVARGRPSNDQLDRLVAAAGVSRPELAESIVGGLANGWPRDHSLEISDESEAMLIPLLERLPTAAKGQLIRLASRWGSRKLEEHAGRIAESLLAVIGDPKGEEAERIAAARQLVQLRPDDPEVVKELLGNVSAQASPELSRGLIETVANSTAPGAGRQLVNVAEVATPATRQIVARVLLRRPATTSALLDAIESGTLQLTDLELEQREALANHPDRAIRRRATALLRAGGGLPNPDREKVVIRLLPLTKETGDVAQGREAFKKHCAKCHTHSGVGQKIGPDLTGMAVHPKQELLVHIIDPSRSVEGNFRSYTVVTIEGRVLTGMLAGESRTSIELIDAEAKRHQIQREDIDELVASKKSLMPDGFEKQMKTEEIVDLLEFLTAKGKYVPLPLDKVATAVSTKGMFHEGDNGPDRMIFPDWSPKVFESVPFVLTDPRGKTTPNIILLHGPLGTLPPQMPRSVSLPCNTSATAIHLLSGVSGWGFPYHREKSVSMIVRLHYADGETEDHPLINGEHFADYIRRVDVPKSQFAFALGRQQLRYLSISPERSETIEEIELVKGRDTTAPIVMAITVERPDKTAVRSQ